MYQLGDVSGNGILALLAKEALRTNSTEELDAAIIAVIFLLMLVDDEIFRRLLHSCTTMVKERKYRLIRYVSSTQDEGENVPGSIFERVFGVQMNRSYPNVTVRERVELSLLLP